MKRIVLVIVPIAIVVAVVTALVLFVGSDSGEDNSGENELIREQAIELTAPVTSVELEAAQDILNSQLSEEQKASELIVNASSKISFEEYEEALVYQEAAYELIKSEPGDLLDGLIYEMILVSRRINDTDRIERYESELGEEKLSVFDTPREKVDEAQ